MVVIISDVHVLVGVKYWGALPPLKTILGRLQGIPLHPLPIYTYDVTKHVPLKYQHVKR